MRWPGTADIENWAERIRVENERCSSLLHIILQITNKMLVPPARALRQSINKVLKTTHIFGAVNELPRNAP